VEAGFAEPDLEALRATVPAATQRPRWGLKSAQQVVMVRRPGEAFVAAADPRTVGAAVAV
jgi:hypothetical protein